MTPIRLSVIRWFLLLFAGVYLCTWVKKMDMLFFPYNDMFSRVSQPMVQAYVYYVKVNGQRIPYSHLPYHKKELMENMPRRYAEYVQDQRHSPLDRFWLQYVPALQKHRPPPVDFPTWANGYLQLAGIKKSTSMQIELMRYTLDVSKPLPHLTDSTLLQQVHVP